MKRYKLVSKGLISLCAIVGLVSADAYAEYYDVYPASSVECVDMSGPPPCYSPCTRRCYRPCSRPCYRPCHRPCARHYRHHCRRPSRCCNRGCADVSVYNYWSTLPVGCNCGSSSYSTSYVGACGSCRDIYYVPRCREYYEEYYDYSMDFDRRTADDCGCDLNIDM